MTATSPGRPGPVGREREATAPEATVLPGTALADLTWPELEADARAGRTVLLVPIGSCEQHGAHLPLDTDARIATGLAQRAAAQRPRVAMVAPPLAYGASGEHAGFPGTLSIGQAALELVLVELGRSADDFGAVVFIQGHGGNARPAERAVATLAAEGRRVRSWWPVIPGGDAHAGRTETSLLLHLDPAAVRPEGWTAGATEPLAALLPRLEADGVRSVSPSGVLGDPTGASAGEGARWATGLVASLTALIDIVVAEMVGSGDDDQPHG